MGGQVSEIWPTAQLPWEATGRPLPTLPHLLARARLVAGLGMSACSQALPTPFPGSV